MTIRHKCELFAKRNYELLYFANAHIAANMQELALEAHKHFDKDYANFLVLMTPFELNHLLDAARCQGRKEW